MENINLEKGTQPVDEPLLLIVSVLDGMAMPIGEFKWVNLWATVK